MQRFGIAAFTALALIACGDSAPSGGKDAGARVDAARGDSATVVADLAGPSDDASLGDDAGSEDAATDDAGSDGGAGPDATVADDAAGGGSCGTCPAGYTCGSANGVAVCRSASGIPLFGSVFVIVMENTSFTTLDQSTNTPFIHSLEMSAAYGTDYHGVAHPSLPNYIALASGGTQSIGCDCDPTGSKCTSFTCNSLIHSCGCAQSARNLADDLEAASQTWKAYAEDMGTACNTTTSGSYAARHVPFLYFTDILSDKARCASHVVDFSSFASDLAGSTPRFSFVAPNLVDDMHDPYPAGSQNLANGDAWLAKIVPMITGSAAYQAGGLLVVVWDEDDYSGVLAADDPIPIFVLSPYAQQNGYSSGVTANHYALLATIEDGLGLPRLGKAAAASPLADYFPAK